MDVTVKRRWLLACVLMASAITFAGLQVRGERMDSSFPTTARSCLQALGIRVEERADPFTRKAFLVVRRRDALKATNVCA